MFLTWCLHGSFSASHYSPPNKASAGQAFVWMDRCLDSARKGPLFLAQQEVAEIVEASILRGEAELGHYRLDSYVVMPNHVHMLVDPLADPSRFLQSLKGYTARIANRFLQRTGEPFWQAESYDHWVRDGKERARIREYIENNPVKAGLAKRPSEFRWSSAHRGVRASTWGSTRQA